MRNFIKNFSMIAAFLIGMTSTAIAQTESSVLEDELSIHILKWHYEKYPLSTSTWTKFIDEDGKLRFQAKVLLEKEKYIATYNTRGNIILEEQLFGKDVPVSISYFLDDNFDKYRIGSFSRVTKFLEQRVEYVLDLKLKTGDLTLKFDEDMNPLPDTTSQMAIGN
ncbi:MAG: hypothetical protein KI790_19725 [Cyclobacteriaceae bacterium]|nr:hypothetical protein [Cyclobacteriaceae bacterium HetDA_MAG_MS6]